MSSILGRPTKFNTVEDLAKAIDKYFKSCYGKDGDGNLVNIRPITLEGLSYDIGCDRHTIWNYKKRVDDNGKPFWPLIKAATDRCQTYLAEHAMMAKNPAGAIWLGCNNYDYVQKTETHVVNEPTTLSTEDVKKFLHKEGEEEVNDADASK